MDFLAQARRQMLAGQMQDAREELLQSFAGLSDEQVLQPGVAGEWSVRDVLAHVAAWDRAVIEQFQAMLKGERHPMLDMDDDGVEQFNAEHYAADKDKSFDEVVTELNASREALVELLREIDNMQMFAPAPGDEHADMSIAALVNVQINHDQEHTEMIEEWREALESEQ